MIRLIVAVDQKMGIAKHGVQPWNIPDDEKYFAQKTKTEGARVLMGRKTYEVMKGALPQRKNYVVTSQISDLPDATVIKDLEKFIADTTEDIWVIGGASIYKWFIDKGLADELYVTHIAADFKCDQFFPVISDQFEEQLRAEKQRENGFAYEYTVYKKVTA